MKQGLKEELTAETGNCHLVYGTRKVMSQTKVVVCSASHSPPAAPLPRVVSSLHLLLSKPIALGPHNAVNNQLANLASVNAVGPFWEFTIHLIFF